MGILDRSTRPLRTAIGILLAFATLVTAGFASLSGQGLRFYRDDPIARVPESQDASKAEPWDIGLMFELSYNLFVSSRHVSSNTRAGNLNTIDEVPDSSWFTNRIGSTALTTAEIERR